MDSQLRFIAELDKLKSVERMISLIGGARRENSAEHSWHLAVMAPLLAEYAPTNLDLGRVMMMLLVHDVVEIDAGDTFAFDAAGAADQHERERRAAVRLFGLLPADQRDALRGCWDEFEARDTAEARFAVAIDRFQGLLMNRGNGGGTWKLHAITREQVLQRMAPIRDGAPGLWPVVLNVLDEVGLARDPVSGSDR
jgi:putative hydrolase of HD superfamily